ncbi:MAG: hypothetical protein GF418_01925 [Chitinivibrionales bacterium]|nr:hypothetical protein [Chitinivibrionales bacterium]MBD3394358.1 hypothetical protein [Chitinivibrionales bacterium]
MRRARPLRFADFLKQLPPAVVFEGLMRPGGTRRKIISSSLISELEKKHATPAATARRFERLSEDARTACALAYLFGGMGLAAAGLESLRPEVLGSFLVYEARDANETPFWLGFADLEKPLRPCLVTALIDACGDVEFPTKGRRQASGPWQPNDFAVTCGQAQLDALRTTQAGALTRAAGTALTKLIHGFGPDCVLESREADAHSMASLLVAYGTTRKFLSADTGRYSTSLEQFEQWNAMPMRKRISDFAAFAHEHSGGWNLELLAEALERSESGWLSSSIFPSACRGDAVSGLRELGYAGVVSVARHGDNTVWRTPAESAPASASEGQESRSMILPDFSALLPQETPPGRLFAFTLLGTLSSLDRVYKGRIDRETVNASLSRGVPGERILTYLTDANAPVNVRETVREWIREFSRLFVSSETVVVSFDEKTSRQLASYDPVKDMLEPLENAHTVFVVKKGRERAARDIISEMGYDVRVPKQTGGRAEDERAPGSPEKPRAHLTPVLDFHAGEKPESSGIRSGKYSSDMKALDTNEVYHVIGYAMLMGHIIRIDYEGGRGTRKGRYRVVPLDVRRGKDSCLEAEVVSTKRKREFDVRCIVRIGVEPHGNKQ